MRTGRCRSGRSATTRTFDTTSRARTTAATRAKSTTRLARRGRSGGMDGVAGASASFGVTGRSPGHSPARGSRARTAPGEHAFLSDPPASVVLVIKGTGSPLGTAEIEALVPALGSLRPVPDDRARIDRIRALEELRSAVAAAQLRETAEFVASQRKQQRAAGVRAERVGRGIADQVAPPRRISPYQAQRYVGAAMVLTRELPRTMHELGAGRTSEWRAMIIARETAWLSREHRSRVDRELAPRLEELGDHAVESRTKELAYRLDPHGYVDRLRSAEKDRRVTLR